MILWCARHERYESVPEDEHLDANTVKRTYMYDCNNVSECKHYDREEINIVLDGKTPPVVRCKDCGAIL